MANTPERDTLICLFHHTDRAERTVQELLEIGIPESAITLIGRARRTTDIDTGTASLDILNVPTADRQRLSAGLEAGGSIVAVSTDSSLASEVEAIFEEYSADKIDEKVISTSDGETVGRGAAMEAAGFPSRSAGDLVDLPPVDRAVLVNPPLIETVSAADVRSSSSSSTIDEDRYADATIENVLLVSEPGTGSMGLIGSPESFTREETLVLLEPTDLVEDTDLLEPRDETPNSGTTSGRAGRFDPDAPVDNVRNPAADRLNDPLNRR